jgi:predicted nucleotidyltransferase
MAELRQPPQLESSLDCLRAMQQEIATKFKIKLVGITGSVARLESKASSDIDIVAETLGRVSLFEVVDAKDRLAEGLGYDVDLIFLKNMPDYKKSLMLRDLVALA